MALTATLIQLLPLQSGESKNGTWRKQDVIVETEGQYPKKICVSIWGDKINESQLQVGNSLIISYELESREFNSKWYTDVKAWKIEIAETKVPIVENSVFITPDSIPEDDEDLPF
ncbi:DUF3127 domain-containing protein [Flavobacterium sp. 83]|uniref:DUF3127 domain-containing protein n=1 Tax=Flavobacterium sp. 83 TaxID=1131812 RepID=UPI00055759FD|nr:DUF3127 domain-containing protein [Flavobacterium sp. 83]